MEHTPEEGVVIERKEEITFLKEPVLDSNTGDAQGDVMVGQVVPFVRKEIPPKKDRMDPLKIDMSKPISMPHTSAQLSLQCLECHIIFSDHKSRERHLKHSHPAEYEQCMLGDALFACYVCDRHFTCSRELMAHQRTHTEKQPFKCPICGDAFSRSSELTHHKKVHFGKHGYTCADCGKPCKTLTLLKYHQRTHTGERPYVCKDCGRRFSMSKALQKHRFLHNYDTKVVEETIFLSSATSTAHTTKLTGPEGSTQGKPTVAFSCCLCGVAFKSAKTMLQHMKHKHSQQREAELNNTVSAGEQLKDGEIMKSQTETCEPIQVLGNMDTFEQGQGLQVIETLGQEQMQQLIETLGQEQTVEHVAIVVQEQLEEQHEDACEQKQPTELELTQKDIATVEEQQVHFGTIELTQAQGQIKNIDMEQAHLHMDTLELELTQDHIETIVLTPVEGHEEAFLLDQTNEQTQRVETAQSPSEEDKAEQANGQVQTEELQHTDGQVGVQLELTQEQVHSGELEQRQPETVQLEQIQGEMEMVELKQIQILEQTETQVIEQGKTQKPMGEGQEENTACDRLEDIQDLSEKTKELQEKTSAQQEKIDECLFQINGTEQEEINHSEHSQNNVLHTHNLEVLAMPTESKDTEESSQISSHAIPLQEIIDESLQVQPKEAQLINEPVKNPQYLKPVEAFPEHTVKEKEQIKHAKKQRKVKQRKPTQTKKGQLVGQFIPPEKQSHSKQDPLQTCKMQKKSVSQCHKQKQKPSTQMTVDKLELKQKSGKEKAKKQDKKVKSHPLLQEKMQQAVPRSSKQMQGVQPRKKLKQIQKAVCQKQSKPKKGQDQVLLKDTQKNRKRGQISEVQFRNQEKFVAEKKLKKQDEANEQKNTNSISLLKDLEQIKQQSLLLLKGHKQPQLKVHKLDPKKTQGVPHQPLASQHQSVSPQKDQQMLPVQKQKRTKTQEPQQNMPIQKRRRQTRNSKGRHKDIRKSHPSNSSLVSSTPPAKSKPPRKRKAPSAGVSEIVHARRALSCEECEERFSDRVALEEHVSALHSSLDVPSHSDATVSKPGEKSPTTLTSENPATQTADKEQDMTSLNENEVGKISGHGGEGVKVVGVVSSGAELCLTLDLLQTPKSNKDVSENSINTDNYGIRVATDWDMEVEMGEIGLGERVERVSFPALNPSPSLASTFLEGEGQGGGEDNRGVNGDRNVIVVPLDSSILDTSKSVPSEKQKLQHEAEIVENQELLDTIGESRQSREPCDTEQTKSNIQPQNTVTTCPLLLHTSSKSFQVKENQNNTNLPNLSLATKLHNFQQSVTMNEAQTKGHHCREKQHPGNEKHNEKTSNGIQLHASNTEFQQVTEEEIKEELLSEVNLVTVGDDSMENHLHLSEESNLTLAGSPQVTLIATESARPSPHINKDIPRGTENVSDQEISLNISETALNSNTNMVSSTTETEVKQEEDEIEVEKKENVRRRALRGRGRRRGTNILQRGGGQMQKVREDLKELEKEKDGCHIVLEVQPLTSDSPIKKEQKVEFPNRSQSPGHKTCNDQEEITLGCDEEEPKICASLSRSCLPTSLEESSDEQLVFELDSVTTSVEVLKTEEGMDGERVEDEGTREKNCQSPCILLERFLTRRERPEEDVDQCQDEMNNEKNTNRTSPGYEVECSEDSNANQIMLMESLRGRVIKVEEYPTESCPTSSSVSKRVQVVDHISQCEKQSGVQIFLVKEEDHIVLNEPQVFPQRGHTKLAMEEMEASDSACLDTEAVSHGNRHQEVEGEQEGPTSLSPLILDGRVGSQQCIFLQVKEEEREVELGSSQEHGISLFVVPGGRLDEQTDACQTSADDQLVSGLHTGPFSSSGGYWMSLSPECRKEQGLPGTDCEEDGQMTETQTKPQNPQELADFLLQNSEAEDSEGNSDSEPEEEACVLARYNEGRRGLANSDKSSRSDQDFNRILPGHSEQAEMSAGNNKESKGEKTPIDYFTSYLDWDTWEEIASCNTAWSESPIPVTAKEMAQFVGIHIAMGTLKFPDLKLYWQDLTRVPLIADTMPASRFFQLAGKVRLGRRVRETETPVTTDPMDKNGNEDRSDGTTPFRNITDGEQAKDPLRTGAGVSEDSPQATCPHKNLNPQMHRLEDPVSSQEHGIKRNCGSPNAAQITPVHKTTTMKTGPTHNTQSYTHDVQRQIHVVGDVVLVRNSDVHNPSPYHSSRQNTTPSSVIHDSNLANTDPLWRVRALLERVRAGCLALTREGNFGVDEYPIHLGRPIRRKSANNARPTLNCAVLVGAGGLILDFNLNVGDSNKEDMIEKMVPRSKKRGEGAVFLCKEELSTPAVLEHLLSAGVKSAARVGGVRGGIGDEFVSSDGKLTLFRCQQGFILSNFSKKQSCPFTIVEDFEGTQKVARLTREMLSLYRTPLSASSAACWPQTVLWHLIDMALVNSWLQYRIDHHHLREPMKLMTFRLEVSKALILSNYSNTPNSSPPPPPLAPQLTSQDSTVSPSPTAHATAPSPDATSRYDGFGHWPEQLSEGEGGRCRFGGCDRTSRVRCLKCCVFLCISQSNNCFLKFHCKGSV
ncbi:zinc finger protein 576, tandem duplicate 1 isoform X2 [Scleropages formosus]|uniref:zinc finger protein 576, tandem duplicate 1 isoform X2 n=1 Tax=Scleropages formosus TaxID=113540 RepID=UPI0010FABF78|nr:uncharacterized protein LOC108922216 isoform X2 [Scleropages formosus]